MNATIVSITTQSLEMNNPTGYAIGALIAIVIFGYLLYSLIKPEKF